MLVNNFAFSNNLTTDKIGLSHCADLKTNVEGKKYATWTVTIYIHIACQGIVAALAMNFKEIRLAYECTSFSRSIMKEKL